MALIEFEITTPERVVLQDKIDGLTVNTKMGEITILPGHIPLISSLIAGEMLVHRNGNREPLAVSGGFIKVTQDKITVLADTAEKVEEIDEERAERARERAHKLLSEKQVDAADYADILGDLNKELTRLKVAKKYRRHRPKRPAID